MIESKVFNNMIVEGFAQGAAQSSFKRYLMFNYITTTVVTTLMGTIIGWLLNAIKTNTRQLYNMSRREHEERVQNRAMLGELLFYRLEDLHRRFVIEGHPCSAAEKQQVDDVYHHYHDELGLNGPGTHMYNEIMEAHQD